MGSSRYEEEQEGDPDFFNQRLSRDRIQRKNSLSVEFCPI